MTSFENPADLPGIEMPGYANETPPGLSTGGDSISQRATSWNTSANGWRSAISAVFAVAVMVFAAVMPVSASPAVPAWRLDTPWTTEQAIVTVGSNELTAEVADTNALRQRGLGYRDGLEPGTAMLFVFDGPSVHTFWMKGMRFCLDIVWIENGTIRGAAENVCPVPGASDAELPRYPSPEPVTFVLEVPGGWLAAHGYGVGTPVTMVLPS